MAAEAEEPEVENEPEENKTSEAFADLVQEDEVFAEAEVTVEKPVESEASESESAEENTDEEKVSEEDAGEPAVGEEVKTEREKDPEPVKVSEKKSVPQAELDLEGGARGKFKDTEESLFEGEDLDIPPYLRKKRG